MPKRIIFLILLLALLLCGCGSLSATDDAPTPTPVATPVPLNEPLQLDAPAELVDDNVRTWVSGQVTVGSGERKIGSLYLKWVHTPAAWTLVADGTTVTVEENGYLHQYLELDEPASEIILNADSALCEVYAFERGAELPDWVQIWEPTYERADLLLIPTHADDEHVFFGGMMPYYAGQLGYKVQVVYLANHWGSNVRPHELLDGLWHAGIRNYPVIGPFADRWTDTVDEAEETMSRYDAAEFLTEQLRRFKPSVVIGHDLKGEYGHAQHVINALALTDAVAAAADEKCFSASADTYGTWNTPKLYLHLYAKNEIIMDWEQPLSAFDGKTAVEVAQEAFALHESQQGFFYVYGEGDDWDSRRFGLYRSLVGPDVIGGDVFENIESFY